MKNINDSKESFQERWVLYMDILGTTDIIRNRPEELLEAISWIAENNRRGDIQYQVAFDGITENVKYEAEFSSFSDHILVSHPHDAARAIQSLIFIAAQIHGRLFQQGLLIRGAITKGSLYHNRNIALGDALIRAVDLEENVARYPRVIIDDKIIQLFQSNIGIGSVIKDQKDNHYFVDYINSPFMMGFTEEQIIDNAITIKRNIESNVFDTNLICKVRKLWLWLAEKFNDYLTNKQKKHRRLETITPIKLPEVAEL